MTTSCLPYQSSGTHWLASLQVGPPSCFLLFHHGYQLANLRYPRMKFETRILTDSAATMHRLMDHGRNKVKKHSPRSGSFAVFKNMVTIPFYYSVWTGHLIDLKPDLKYLLNCWQAESEGARMSEIRRDTKSKLCNKSSRIQTGLNLDILKECFLWLVFSTIFANWSDRSAFYSFCHFRQKVMTAVFDNIPFWGFVSW